MSRAGASNKPQWLLASILICRCLADTKKKKEEEGGGGGRERFSNNLTQTPISPCTTVAEPKIKGNKCLDFRY